MRPVIGEHLHVVEREGIAESLLREREVHADRIDIHVVQLAGLFIEPLGLRIANRRIERGHHAEDARPVPVSLRCTGFSELSTAENSGAVSPAFSSGPTRVMGLPSA